MGRAATYLDQSAPSVTENPGSLADAVVLVVTVAITTSRPESAGTILRLLALSQLY